MGRTRWSVVAALLALTAGSAVSFTIPIPDDKAGSHAALVNPNATIEAKGLMRYLSSIYGSHVLSGHQLSYSVATGNDELAKIKGWTGEAPALRGFDFMDVINGWGAPNAAEGLKWGASGGIVSLCWHWRLGGKDFYSPSYHAGGTSFPSGDPATNSTINDDLKKLGDELQKFADAKIAVLWRPLHEPPGNWFWWHDGGADQYKKLWIRMYDYLVNTRKLNNLIWVYSSSDGGASRSDWYPGNQYVDIVGVDGYGGQWQNYWNGLQSISGGKRMAAMTENGKFPDWNKSYPYLWVLSWNNEIFNGLGANDFKAVYNDPNTINFDDLPTVTENVTWKSMIGKPGPVVVSQPEDIRVTTATTFVASAADLAKVFLDATDGTDLVWSAKVTGSSAVAAQVTPSGKVDLSIQASKAEKATVQVSATNKAGGVATASFDVVVRSFDGNLALNQPGTASSTDAYAQAAWAVFDGSASTRWSSAYKDGEWVMVDLDTVLSIDSVVLNWEVAYASSYVLSVSVDSVKWTDVKTVANGAGGIESATFPAVKARWIRLIGTKRATEYGISLWEMEVYGKQPACCSDVKKSLPLAANSDRVAVFGLDGKPAGILFGVDADKFRRSGRLAGLRPGVYLAVVGGRSRKVLVGE